MTARTRSAGSALRTAAGSFWAVMGIALAFHAAPASAWPEDRGPVPRPVRHQRASRLPAAPPPPAIVSGYLPRNHNVPMYNEPPPRGPRW